MYQMVRGLGDSECMERVLQAAAQVEGGELSLHRVVKLCEALEMGKASKQFVDQAGASLNRLSDHQKNKSAGRQKGRDKPGQGGDTTGGPSGCSNCGSKGHGSRLSERRDKCPAFMEECNGCGVVGH